MYIDKSIFYQPIFLIILSLFLVSIGQIYHLGIIGVIVSVRAGFVTYKHYKLSKNFIFDKKNNNVFLQYGAYKDLLILNIDSNEIKTLEEKIRGLYRKKITIIKLSNGTQIPLEYVGYKKS